MLGEDRADPGFKKIRVGGIGWQRAGKGASGDRQDGTDEQQGAPGAWSESCGSLGHGRIMVGPMVIYSEGAGHGGNRAANQALSQGTSAIVTNSFELPRKVLLTAFSALFRAFLSALWFNPFDAGPRPAALWLSVDRPRCALSDLLRK
jgi:hypothetical protein